MVGLNELKYVDTPARYTGGEARSVIKNKYQVTSRIALALPTMYELGFSDNDLNKLYYTLNLRRDTWAERVFAPVIDYESLIRNKDEKLATLESKTALRDMDVIIFIVSNELMYTNILNMLNMGGVPCLRERRKEGYPLVVLTGNAVLNPKPMEDFTDLYIIGEPNKVINEVMDAYKRGKEGINVTKKDILESMKYIPGVYIPDVTDDEQIVNMVYEDVNEEQYIKNYVCPSIPVMDNKSKITLTKGCKRDCINCSNRFAYGNMQNVSVDKAVIKAGKLMDTTGNLNIMLESDCHLDYNGYPEVIYRLKDIEKPKMKTLSFSNIRLDRDNLWVIKHLDIKGNYPTIMVGAPTEVLREKIGFGMTEAEVLDVAREIFKSDFDKVRLEYILGIPGENYEDFKVMIDTANKVCDVYKEVYAKSPDKYIVEIKLTNFSIKPHTPSQWCAVNNSENIEIKTKYILEKNKNQDVVINNEDGKQTEISTLLARGGKEVGAVIYEAWKQGARFDMMSAAFDKENWQVGLTKNGIELKKYLEEQNDKLLFPWDNIKVGTSSEELRRTYLARIKHKED